MPKLSLVRGDVVYVDLSGATGGEKHGVRPCLVVQNDQGNQVSPLTIIAPITDAAQYKGYPMQVVVKASDLRPDAKDSVIEGGHLRSIDRDARIDSKIGVWCHLSDDVMAQVDEALRASLAL
jgi:mRNA interferase MazF